MMCLLLLVSLIVPNQPGTNADPYQVDVTATLNQNEVKAEFPIQNDSKKPISIVNITTSCGCTTAESDRRVYLPGERGTVSVTVNIADATGDLVKNVVIETSDSESRFTHLGIKIHIPSVITILPDAYLRWDKDSVPSCKVATVAIDSPLKFRITGVRSASDDFVASVSEIEAYKTYRVSVTPRATDVVLNSAVELLTDAPWSPSSPKKLWLLVHIKPSGQN